MLNPQQFQETITRFGKEFETIMETEDKLLIKKFFATFESLDELAIKCIMWGHFFLPKYFPSASPGFHFNLVRKFFNHKNEYNAYPRGFGKTTLIQLCICYSLVNGLDEFIVLIEKTFTEASEVLEAIREEFKMNDRILWVYGELSKIGSQNNLVQDNLKDSVGDFFINGCRLRGKGFDSPIRGLKSRHTRPTRIVLDDVESDEHIENVEQRQKYLSNYIKGIIPAQDNRNGVTKMWGTILHDDSLLSTLIKNHDGEILRAWDKDRVLLWPTYWTIEKLENKRSEMAIDGKGDSAFYQEYFNEPVSEEDAIFNREMFHYFNKLQLESIKKRPHNIYIMVDPAISKRETADYTAIVAVLVDQLNRIYVLEIIRMRMDPIETIKALFAMYERWQPIAVGVESVAYQKSLIYFINEEKKRKNSIVRSMVVKEVKADTDKARKIKGLQPRYAIGNIYHNSDDQNTKILESELTRFPRGATDDIIDALASVNQMITGVVKRIDKEYSKYHALSKSHNQAKY
jgi:predicted phage terminase large subunit-like protein